MEKISISVPRLPGVLRAVAAMFEGLAEDAATAPSAGYAAEAQDLLDRPKDADPGPTILGLEPTPPAPAETFATPGVVPIGATPEGQLIPGVPPSATEETATPPPPPPANVDLDADGLPWDERIHSRGKTKTKSGQWRKLRGVEPELVASVEDELHALMVVGPPPVPPVAPESAPPVTPETVTYGDLMQKITAGTVKPDRVTEVLAAHDVPSLVLLASRPDLIASVDAGLFGGV